MDDPATKNVKQVTYPPGLGKTGLVAQLGKALVINHYGTGNLNTQKLLTEYDKYNDASYSEMNLVGYVKDSSHRQVGLARLIGSAAAPPFSNEDEEAFRQFLETTCFDTQGLTSHEKNYLCE